MSQRYRTLRVAPSDEDVLSVVIDAPPMNLIGPELVRDLVGLLGTLESDQVTRVMVLESADPDYFVSHVDLTKVAEYTAEAAKAGGPDDASLGMLWHKLSELPVITIAKIRGRVRGAGSELALACGMRFAARENAILGQIEVGAGTTPGAGGVQHLARLLGRGRVMERFLARTTSTANRPNGMAGRRVGSAARSTGFELVNGLGTGFDGGGLGQLEHPQDFHWPIAGLRAAVGPAAGHRPSSGFGVEGVGLAPPTAGGLIGRIDLDHLNPGRSQVPAQRRTVGASALHSGPPQYPERAYPRQQRLIAGCGSGERLGFLQHAQRREHRCHAHVLVSIHPHDNFVGITAGLALSGLSTTMLIRHRAR